MHFEVKREDRALMMETKPQNTESLQSCTYKRRCFHISSINDIPADMCFIIITHYKYLLSKQFTGIPGDRIIELREMGRHPRKHQRHLLLTWFNFNPIMDK